MQTLFEFLVVLLVLASLALSSQFRNWLSSLQTKLQLFFASLVLFMLLGHFGRSSAQSFPFVSWDMYTEYVGDSNLYYVELVGKTLSGDSVPINPSKLYPSLGFGSLRINNLLHEIGRRASVNQANQADIELIMAIATTFNNRNSTVRIQEISLSWVEVSFKEQTKNAQVVLKASLDN